MLRGAPKTRLQGAPSSQHDSPRRLLSTRRRLSTLDSQLFHSRPRLALGSRNSRSGCRLCGQRGLEFSTMALGKAFSMAATTQPHTSSFVIHPLHRLWFYDPERAIRTSLRARPELRARATPRGRVNPRVRLTNWLLAATPGQAPEDGLWLVRWKICIHTKMFHRSFSPRSNCK